MYRLVLLLLINLIGGSFINAQNRIDSLGLKQGFWVELEAKPDIIGISHLDLDNGAFVDKMNYDFGNYTVLKYTGCYKQGLRSGEWNVFSPNDSIRYTITYKNGVEFGSFILYYPNGETKLRGCIGRNPMTRVSYFDKKGVYIKNEDWFTSGLIERLNR